MEQKVETDFKDIVNGLINTSVEDMTSSLKCAEVNKTASFNSAVLQKAYDLVVRRGEKTKAKVIKSFISKAVKYERTRGNTYGKMSIEQLLDMLKAGVSPVAQVKVADEILRREKAFRKKVENALAEIEDDERLGYPTATVFENAPLALVQCGLENQRRALKYVLMALDVMEGEE